MNLLPLTILDDDDRLDLSAHHHDMVWAISSGAPLVWGRHGLFRRIPKSIMLDALRVIEDRLNAPERNTADLPPVTVEWSVLAPEGQNGDN